MKTPAEELLIPLILVRIQCADSLVLIWAGLGTGEIFHTVLHSFN